LYISQIVEKRASELKLSNIKKLLAIKIRVIKATSMQKHSIATHP